MTKIDVELINECLKLIIPLISLILTSLVYPWIKSKIGAEKLSEIEKYAEIVVRSVEMIYTPEEWEKKKAYAMSYITLKAEEIGIEMSTEDLNNLIESTVNYVKYGTEYKKG